MENNQIERQIEIKASVEKVWNALTDSKQFEQWFGMDCEGPFVAGKTTKAKNRGANHDHMRHDLMIQKITPQTYFSYKWVPYPYDLNFDYSQEEPTLVEFWLEPTSMGTLLKVKESGFTKITASRRVKAFQMHTGGWEAQLKNIEKFLVEKK